MPLPHERKRNFVSCCVHVCACGSQAIPWTTKEEKKEKRGRGGENAFKNLMHGLWMSLPISFNLALVFASEFFFPFSFHSPSTITHLNPS